MGYWDIITPLSGRNYHKNPSVEIDSVGYNPRFTGVLVRTTTFQRRGVWAIQYTPGANVTDGIDYVLDVPVSKNMTFSIDFKGTAGLGYRLKVFNINAGNFPFDGAFTASGGWDRPAAAFVTAAAASQYIFTICKDNHTINNVFYTDGWLITEGTAAPTYFDGNSEGCLWLAHPHKSASIRPESAPGGLVFNFDNLENTKVLVEAQAGTGVGPVQNYSVQSAQQHGSRWQRTLAKARTFNLRVWLEGVTHPDLLQTRRNLVEYMYPGRPFQLRYRGGTSPLVLNAIYDAGLELGDLQGFVERGAIRFVSHQPFWEEEGETGVTLGLQATGSTTYLARHAPDGNITRLITTATGGIITCMAQLPDGRWALGGSFLTLNGVTCNCVCLYDENTGTVTAMGNGVAAGVSDRIVNALVVSPDGYLYVGGDFANAHAVANTAMIARFNLATSTWSALPASGARPTRPVNVLLYIPEGQLHIGLEDETFQNWKYHDGVTFFTPNAVSITKAVRALVYRTGTVIAGGDFKDVIGTALLRVAQWKVTGGGNPLPLGGGIGDPDPLVDASVTGLEYDEAGQLYIVGSFDRAGGDTSIQGCAIWTGSAYRKWFTPSGSFVTGSIKRSPNGEIWLSAIQQIDGVARNATLMRWTGSTWLNGWHDGLPVEFMAFTPDGTAYTTWGINPKQSALTNVSNNGTADANPLVVIKGPGDLLFVKNGRTGVELHFTGLVLLDGEYVHIQLGQLTNKVVSTFRGDLTQSITPGSRLASFVLVPGVNPIEVFMAGSTYDGAKANGVMVWKPLHWTVDGSMP